MHNIKLFLIKFDNKTKKVFLKRRTPAILWEMFRKIVKKIQNEEQNLELEHQPFSRIRRAKTQFEEEHNSRVTIIIFFTNSMK